VYWPSAVLGAVFLLGSHAPVSGDAGLTNGYSAHLAPSQAARPAICFAPETPLSYMERMARTYGGNRRWHSQVGGGEKFQLASEARWQTTATADGPLLLGDPTVLTWSYSLDGTPLASVVGEPPRVSELRSWLDSRYGGFADWHPLFVQAFERWSERTGLTFRYEPADDGAALPGTAGVLAQRGDIRFGGHPIDGNGGILAFGFFPVEGGDAIFDTGDLFFSSATSLQFSNILGHEIGHAVGLDHVCPRDRTKLMEPRVSTEFDGPQHDDLLGSHRAYGDRFEPNDGPLTATILELDASSTATFEASLDDGSDLDLLRFEAGPGVVAKVTLSPLGSTYLEGPQLASGGCSAGSSFDSSALINLRLELLAGDSLLLVAAVDASPAGFVETLSGVDLGAGGRFYLRIFGASANAAQLYRVRVELTPNPATGSCSPSATALCLNGDRFRVEARWRTLLGQAGEGHPARLTDETGTFWFFDPDNVELIVKVLGGCSVNGHFWLFAGGLTNVEVELTVTDTETATQRRYRNPLSTAFQPILDTTAFATCP